MKLLAFLTIMVFCSISLIAQTSDTILINAKSLELKNLQQGKYSYVMFSKKGHDSAAQKLTLINMNIQRDKASNSINILEEWESADTIVHFANTALNAESFSTDFMRTWWRRLGYTIEFDFLNKKVKFDKKISDSVSANIITDFNNSFSDYNLNWHADFVLLSVLPYKEGRSFKINYYDPGFGAPKAIIYSFIGSEIILDNDSKPVDCYILKYIFSKEAYQKFWISKKSREVLKEEDLFNGNYRYKIKLNSSSLN